MIPARSHFKVNGHNFMKHAKFTLIEHLAEISNVSKDTLRLQLKRREDFSIIKLETLGITGLNQELNNVSKSNKCIFSSLNSHLLQLGRKRRHYDVFVNI